MKTLFFLASFVVSVAAFSSTINPSDISKAGSSYKMAWGEQVDEFFVDYLVDGKVKFHVLESLVDIVDGLIAAAAIAHLPLLIKDDEVEWFYEKDLIFSTLIVISIE